MSSGRTSSSDLDGLCLRRPRSPLDHENVTRFAYDLLDRRTKVTDALGRMTVYGYDTLSRLVSASNPAIQSGPLAQQGFTLNGQRASLTDANGNATSYTYDGFDRLTTTTWPNTSYETLGYDSNSNTAAMLCVSRRTAAGAGSGWICQRSDLPAQAL